MLAPATTPVTADLLLVARAAAARDERAAGAKRFGSIR